MVLEAKIKVIGAKLLVAPLSSAGNAGTLTFSCNVTVAGTTKQGGNVTEEPAGEYFLVDFEEDHSFSGDLKPTELAVFVSVDGGQAKKWATAKTQLEKMVKGKREELRLPLSAVEKGKNVGELHVLATVEEVETVIPQMEFKKKTVDLATLYSSSTPPSVPKSEKKGKKKGFKFMRSKSKAKIGGFRFGCPLDPTSEEIPSLVVQSVQYLQNNGITTEGLFRQSANTNDIERLKKLAETGKDIPWEQESPHVVAGLLMTYLLQLPEPLLTFDLYESLIAAQETIPSREERIKFISKLLRMMPICFKYTLTLIIGFLCKMTEYAEQSKMNAGNLAIVFGPALMRKEVEEIKQIVADSPLIIQLVKVMIEEFRFLFLGGEIVGDPEELAKQQEAAAAAAKEAGSSRRTRRMTLRSEMVAGMEALLNADPNEFVQNPAQLTSLLEVLVYTVDNIQQSVASSLSELNQAMEEEEPEESDVEDKFNLVLQLTRAINQPTITVEEILNARLPPLPEGDLHEAHAKLQEGFQYILTSLADMSKKLKEDILFLEQDQCIELALSKGHVISTMKEVLTNRAQKKERDSGDTVDQHLKMARNIIKNLAGNLQATYVTQLREELASQRHMNGAVVIARVVRAFKKALNDETREAVSTTIVKPSYSQEDVEALDEAKLNSIVEVMQYSFEEIEEMLDDLKERADEIDSVVDSTPLVQLLVAVKKFLDEYLKSEASMIVPFEVGVLPLLPPSSAFCIGRARMSESAEAPAVPEDHSEESQELLALRDYVNSLRMELSSSSCLESGYKIAKLATLLKRPLEGEELDQAELHDVKALPGQGEQVVDVVDKEKLMRFKGIASGAMDQLLGFVSYQSGLLSRGGHLDDTAMAQAHAITNAFQLYFS
mmetsp:Transcript_22717/g.89852  ORF Transcript_22717/g.89852 Transcript_22717/m.89852 type:complete len:889 (+) Transcript_22717:76-2742(+)